MSRRLTLRRTLVLGIVGLLAAVTVAIGVFSALALDGFLLARLDKQLGFTVGRSEDAFIDHGEGFPAPPPPSDLLNVPG